MMVILVIFVVERNYMMIIFVCARENQKYDYVLHLEARIFVSLFVCSYKGNCSSQPSMVQWLGSSIFPCSSIPLW